MKQTKTDNIRGEKNSSLTRVRFFFRILFDQDASGLSWLPKLLEMAPLNSDLAFKTADLTSRLLDRSLAMKKCMENKTKTKREKCFEYSLAPSCAFLRWLIDHPEKLKCPKSLGISDDTILKRECLLGRHGVLKQKEIMQNAIDLLIANGTSRSKGKWWALEGFTVFDCLLETEGFLLGIEGKRTEKESKSISWYPKRNQIIRNLEAIKEKAGSKAFAVLLMSEDGKDPIKDADFSISLPHYSPHEIADLRQHYLGAVSWQQACYAVGIDPDKLPETIRDVCHPNINPENQS